MRTTAVTMATVLALGACTDGASDGGTSATTPSPTSVTSPTPTPTSSPSSSPRDAASPSPPDGGTTPAVPPVTWTAVGQGFTNPLQVLPGPTGTTWVVEQDGRIRTLAREVVLDLRDRVTSGGERGLLGAAVAPDDRHLVAHWSGRDGRTVLAAYPLVEGRPDVAGETTLLTVAQPAANHNGGSVQFAPDGSLLLALGDGGAAGDRFGNGQRPDTRLATILRMQADLDRGTVGPAPGNPFDGAEGDELVWAYGLRNPYRITIDDGWLYVADVGQDAVEEVDVVALDEVAGANFGWPIREGTACFARSPCDVAGLVDPVVEHRHDEEPVCSVIGGEVVRDPRIPGLAGVYLYSDLCDPRLRGLVVAPDGTVTPVTFPDAAAVPGRPLGFGHDAQGRVYVGTAEGVVHRLVPGS